MSTVAIVGIFTRVNPTIVWLCPSHCVVMIFRIAGLWCHVSLNLGSYQTFVSNQEQPKSISCTQTLGSASQLQACSGGDNTHPLHKSLV